MLFDQAIERRTDIVGAFRSCHLPAAAHFACQHTAADQAVRAETVDVQYRIAPLDQAFAPNLVMRMPAETTRQQNGERKRAITLGHGKLDKFTGTRINADSHRGQADGERQHDGRDNTP